MVHHCLVAVGAVSQGKQRQVPCWIPAHRGGGPVRARDSSGYAWSPAPAGQALGDAGGVNVRLDAGDTLRLSGDS